MSTTRTVGSAMRDTCLALWLIAGLSGSGLAGTINDIGGVAIEGHDPVAYFTDNQAVLGSDAFTAQYEGSTFKFASAEHRDAFVADPEKYVPQYGGFCAYGTAAGYKAVSDPEAFTIVDGKLYLNYSRSVQAEWVKDIPGYVAKANENWPDVLRSGEVHQ